MDETIQATAALDGRSVDIRIVQDPGSAGKRDAVGLVRMLAGYPAKIVQISGAKDVRARALAAQVNVGNVSAVHSERRVVTGPYKGRTTLEALLIMLQNFPFGRAKKDGVDAAADAFNDLTVPDEEKRPESARAVVASIRRPAAGVAPAGPRAVIR